MLKRKIKKGAVNKIINFIYSNLYIIITLIMASNNH